MTIYTKCTKCGKEIHFNGISTKDAEYKQRWYDNNAVCAECKQKEYEARRDALAAEREALIESLGLPEITKGSPKQIAWAISLRKDMIKGLIEVKTWIDEKVKPEYKDVYAKAIDEFFTSNDAVFFIDNRECANRSFDFKAFVRAKRAK